MTDNSADLPSPAKPADISRFTSNTLFGQPGIYPHGPAMEPAHGDPIDDKEARRLVEQVGATAAIEAYDSAELGSVTEVPQLRAAAAMLAGGPADPILAGLLEGGSHISHLGVAELSSPGRVIGDAAQGPRPGSRYLNARYAAEHPAVVAPSLAHAICHHDGEAAGQRASNAEEVTLHGILASVHASLLASNPALADLGTELSRRQASLTITLLNARSPGSDRPSIVCPDGPGTIPGGNPDLQCPDLWSIPFTSADPADCATEIPGPVRAALSMLAPAGCDGPPASYGEDLGRWLEASVCEGPGLDAAAVRASGTALGLW
ncbi:MAG: hypothetical protein GY812_11550 [Actinomycetia bacterium]|nr:hypothetical protein [Actinomycetes bacterium]